MFTGIIQSFAFIQNIDLKNNIYNMKTNLDLNDCQIGSSICCDGVCLTITNILNDSFSVNIGEETVKKTNNLKYYNLINSFYELTSVPIILNTSFNENEPIVNTPQEAINCFQRTDMDLLVIGNYVISR